MIRAPPRWHVISLLALVAVSASCTDDQEDDGETTSATIGPNGGVVTLEGATLEIPAGALTDEVTIAITSTTRGPPSGWDLFSPVYRFEPEGLTFAVPATLSLQFQGDQRLATIFWSRTPGAGGGYERLGGVPGSGVVRAEITHFSTGFVADGVEYPDPPDRSCTVVELLKRQRYGSSAQVPFFTVDDCQGRPVIDLTCPDYPGDCDFALLEDGVPLSSEAAAVILPQKGLTPFIALTVDMSSSTREVLSDVIAGAKSFVHAMQGDGNPQLVQIALYAFAGEAEVTELQSATLDESVLTAKLDSLATFEPADPSSTNLYGAILGARARIAAAQAAFEARNYGGALATSYLVLFTDGRDTAALATLDDVRLCSGDSEDASGANQCFDGGGASFSIRSTDGYCPNGPRCSDGSCCTAGTQCVSTSLDLGSNPYASMYRCVQPGQHLCPAQGSLEGTCPGDAICDGPVKCCCTTDECNERRIALACGVDHTNTRSAELLVVGLRTTDYDRDALRALSGAGGLIESLDSSTLERDFGTMANRIKGRLKRTYLLGYCSPKRNGTHAVAIAVTDSTGVPATYEFDATGYGPGCDEGLFQLGAATLKPLGDGPSVRAGRASV